MEPTSVIDDAEFSLPPEFLTDDDFLVEKAWGSTRCGAGGRQNQNRQMQVSSQKVADELALMNINGCNNHNGKGLLDLPRKHLLAAAKIPNDGSGYYNRQSLHYQKLQAIQQLKQQQQLVRYRRQLIQQSRGLGANNNNNNKIAGSVDLLPSAWSNQPQKLDVVLGNRTGKRGSTGTGVFLPRCVNNATGEVRERPMVPARVVQPSVRSSPCLNDGSWGNDGGFSSQMKMEQPAKEPMLPLDWAY